MDVGVYGLGRFGTFWASCLAEAGCNVKAYSRSEHPLPPGVARGSEEEILTSQYLFFAVSISSFESVLKRVGSRIGKDTVVMDTCSVKILPRRWMRENIPPISPAEDERYRSVKALFQRMDLDVLEMSAEEHDEEAAYSQGVTHFVGRTLSAMGMKPTPIATQGYRSLMTIVEQTCNDPVQLFYDLQRFNPYAKEMRLSLQVAVEKVLNALRREEED